jgi:hypothetical protein
MKYPAFISRILVRRGLQRLSKKIAKFANENWSAKQTIDFLFSHEADLITPWQSEVDIRGLAKEIEKNKPNVVV